MDAWNDEPGGGEVKVMCLPKSMKLLPVQGKSNGSSRPLFLRVELGFVPGGRGLPSRAGLVPGTNKEARDNRLALRGSRGAMPAFVAAARLNRLRRAAAFFCFSAARLGSGDKD